MRVRHPFEMPGEVQAKLKRALRLEWWTILANISIVAAMSLTMGSSQAMKAAWADDILGFVPPIALLVANHFRSKHPNDRFPYGYHRSVSIAFLVGSVALLGFGAILLVDSAMVLFQAEHPTIQTVEVGGYLVWQGWLMIAALLYSIVPQVVLARKKIPLAKELHEKVLNADAEMNRAAWMTAAAAVGGILGIGFGWWWADGAAAAFISVEILRDGLTNLKHAVLDLMDERPTTVSREQEDPLRKLVRDRLEQLDWVEGAAVRLREEGDVLTGEAYVVPRDENGLLDRLEGAREQVQELDWRIYDVVVVPVKHLNGSGGNGQRTDDR